MGASILYASSLRSIIHGPSITDAVFMDIGIGGSPAGRIVIGLHGHAVPHTAMNFLELGEDQDGKARCQGWASAVSCHAFFPSPSFSSWQQPTSAGTGIEGVASIMSPLGSPSWLEI